MVALQFIRDTGHWHWNDRRQESWKGDLSAFPYEGQCNTSGRETQISTILPSRATQEMAGLRISSRHF